MGFVQAFVGAIGGTFADQWKDFYGPIENVPATAGFFPGTQIHTVGDRGSNVKGSPCVISNGSRVIVPVGTALIAMQDGAITNVITQPGGYIYQNEDPNSRSIFTGDGIVDSLIKTSWERFKFGGIPASQQLLFYVNLKEIPGNRFGTQSAIYWDDAFFGTQVGAMARGSYSLQIVDPVLFVQRFLPSDFYGRSGVMFDFADMDNPACEQLFNEVVGSLAAAFSNYTNDASRGNRMAKIQGDAVGFGAALGQAVEDAYQWKSGRGLEIVKSTIVTIEYDEDSMQLMTDVKRADALSGARGNSFMQQAAARGMQAAGENGGGASMAFMGMGMQAAGQMVNGMQQPGAPSSYHPNFGQESPAAPVQPSEPAANQQRVSATEGSAESANQEQISDPAAVTEKLLEMKKLLDAGVLTQEEFDKVKTRLLGL